MVMDIVASHQIALAPSPELLASRLVVGGMLVMAGVSKVGVPGAFARDILDYRLTTARHARLLARILPSMELLIGVCFVVGMWLLVTSVLTIALLLVFSGAVGLNLAHGRRFPCHCVRRSGSAEIGAATLLRNVRLIAATLYVLSRSTSLPNGLPPWTLWQSDARVLTDQSTLVALLGSVALVVSVLLLLGHLDLLQEARALWMRPPSSQRAIAPTFLEEEAVDNGRKRRIG